MYFIRGREWCTRLHTTSHSHAYTCTRVRERRHSNLLMGRALLIFPPDLPQSDTRKRTVCVRVALRVHLPPAVNTPAASARGAVAVPFCTRRDPLTAQTWPLSRTAGIPRRQNKVAFNARLNRRLRKHFDICIEPNVHTFFSSTHTQYYYIKYYLSRTKCCFISHLSRSTVRRYSASKYTCTNINRDPSPA